MHKNKSQKKRLQHKTKKVGGNGNVSRRSIHKIHHLNNSKKHKHINTRRNYKKKLLPVVYGKLHMIGCGHCENLIPEWNILNEKMKMHVDVVCYDIERSEESSKLPIFNNNYKPYENLQIQGGYPTIYKLHKRGGAIIYYNGPRDSESLFQWLQGKDK